jgi:hypothetical protein
MKEEILPYLSDVRKIIGDYLVPVFCNRIDDQIKFVKGCEVVLKNYAAILQNISEEKDSLKLMLKYHNDLYSVIRTKYLETEKNNFDNHFSLFAGNINSFLLTIEDNIIRIQDEERFIINKTDGLFLRILKRLKNLFFFISKIPLEIGNIFRKLFRKPVKARNRWAHKIPLRNLTTFFLRDVFSSSAIEIINEINKSISKTSLSVWKIDEEIGDYKLGNKVPMVDFNEDITELENLKTDVARLTEKAFEEKIEDLENAYKKVGTIELSYRRFNNNKIEKKHDSLNEKYETINKNWSNTFFALFEDWRMNKELYVLREKIYTDYREILFKSNDVVENNIKPGLNEIKIFLDDVALKFSEFSGSSIEAKELLNNEKDRIFKNLTEDIIISTSELILVQNIPDLIDIIEYKVNRSIKNLSDKRAIVKKTSYDQGIKDSELEYISPNEVITYSAVSGFIKSCKDIKSSLMLNLEEIQKGLKDIDQIADFNIESAISMYQTEEVSENPVGIALEGIKRAKLKSESIENKVDEIKLKISKDLNEAVEKINDQLIKLTQSENIFDIKLKIVKSKALQRTEELKQKTIKSIRNFIPVLVSSIKKGFDGSKRLYLYLRKKFGLNPPPRGISSEVSDFLAATEIAISKLPFVYQRLFRIEPLEDERFFEGREKELEKISLAFNNWEHKKFAPVIIFGEKGSGITTLLNFFFREINLNYAVKRTSVKSKIYTEGKFIDFFKNILENKSLETHYDVIDYLNDNSTRQIIVVENLQNLFLKKVGGFTCLKILFEIISKTNKNVFWIITSNLYSWEYLGKVMNVSDYFGYQVKLGQLNNQQMIDIILRRHRISGYNIRFAPENPELVKKKYKKLSEKEMQDILIEDFFSDLNRFAKSNISPALLYWMRSTKEVTSDSITLSSVNRLATSFFDVINQEKIFILYLLLLHDGLSEDDVALIYDKPPNEMRLVLLALYDDGIVIKREDLFIINPLLYRQIIFLLESKNILH